MMWVVISDIGTVSPTVYGPFDTVSAAFAWADKNGTHWGVEKINEPQ